MLRLLAAVTIALATIVGLGSGLALTRPVKLHGGPRSGALLMSTVVPPSAAVAGAVAVPVKEVFLPMQSGAGNYQLKAQVLQLGAALDRGQAYNPTSGEYYKDRMDVAKSKILELVSKGPPLPSTLAAMDGEWELVLSTVPYGIFRSSPFFLAIQEAYTVGGAPDKANLFFKLHELQTCSWGASKVGRVAQYFDSGGGGTGNPGTGMMYSEFDTAIFSLTVIPILGWFKLLPTFGGCVVTASKCALEGDRLEFEVEYTTGKPVAGLQGLGEWIWGIKVPVNPIWKLLPWNRGRAPTSSVALKYCDDDFRIVEDSDGELFVYTRPVASRPL